MNKWKIVLIFLILLLFAINYSFLDKAFVNLMGDSITDYKDSFVGKSKYVEVGRVIDGDTIVMGNESVRLLGINSPEKGEAYYSEAKEFLEGLILDKKIRLEVSSKKDMYDRVLAFVFISQTNLNVELVRWGFANVYILDERKYEDELREAWEECVVKGINLCEESHNECAGCIEVQEFSEQSVVFVNKCYLDCSLDDWEIKDEGRKKFVFEDFVLKKGWKVEVIVGEGEDCEAPQAYPETFPLEKSTRGKVLYWRGEDYVWTDTGDTLYLRDDEGKLVLWERYL